jgi:hypothetical protein
MSTSCDERGGTRRDETRRHDDSTTTRRERQRETRCSATTWHGMATQWDGKRDNKGQRDNATTNQPNNQTNRRMNKQSGWNVRRRCGKRWRCDARGWRRQILCPRSTIPLPWNIIVVVGCCVVFPAGWQSWKWDGPRRCQRATVWSLVMYMDTFILIWWGIWNALLALV